MKILKIVGMSVLAISLSGCSIIPIMAAVSVMKACPLPDVPELPPTTEIEERRVVVLEREDMAELLIYFEGVERCK